MDGLRNKATLLDDHKFYQWGEMFGKFLKAPPPPVEDEEPTQPPTQRRKRKPSEPHPNAPAAPKIFLKFGSQGRQAEIPPTPLPPHTITPPSQQRAEDAAKAFEQLTNSQVAPLASNISKRRASVDYTRRDASPEDPDEPKEGEEDEQTANEADMPTPSHLEPPLVVVDPVDVSLDDPPIPNEPEVLESQLTVTIYYEEERLDHDLLFDRKLLVSGSGRISKHLYEMGRWNKLTDKMKGFCKRGKDSMELLLTFRYGRISDGTNPLPAEAAAAKKKSNAILQLLAESGDRDSQRLPNMTELQRLYICTKHGCGPCNKGYY
ncbi:MAG: hypothetical protein Q9198_003018 [Flavoplaca austrocitrina]